jgi:hypothetical protein
MRLVSNIIEQYRKEKKTDEVGAYVGNKTKLIPVPFNVTAPQVGLPYFFAADNSIDGDKAVITQIELLDVTQVSKVQSGANLIDGLTYSVFNQGIFVAVNIRQEIIMQIPLYNLCTIPNGEKPCLTWLDEHVWGNCYILFTSLTGIGSQGLNFRVSYFDKQLPV